MKTDDRARFKHIGEDGDQKLNGTTVSIVGMGAMGASAAEMLARENINLRLVDKGRVEEEDMHRLALFYEEDITKFKVKQAKARLLAINPTIDVKSFHEELSSDNVFLVKGDVIIDTSNNREINEIVSSYVNGKTPLVIARYSGSVAHILVVFKKVTKKMLDAIDLPSISEEGVFGPVTSETGSIIVGEVIKILVGEKTSSIISFDKWKNKMKVTKI